MRMLGDVSWKLFRSSCINCGIGFVCLMYGHMAKLYVREELTQVL